MSKHTPGTWRPRGSVVLLGDNATMRDESTWIDCNTEANARLTAAAPEMLEALEKIISSWERERLHSNQGNNHAQDEAELEKNYQIALAKLMIYEKIKAAK